MTRLNTSHTLTPTSVTTSQPPSSHMTCPPSRCVQQPLPLCGVARKQVVGFDATVCYAMLCYAMPCHAVQHCSLNTHKPTPFHPGTYCCVVRPESKLVCLHVLCGVSLRAAAVMCRAVPCHAVQQISAVCFNSVPPRRTIEAITACGCL
jgi:hypothetical protein